MTSVLGAPGSGKSTVAPLLRSVLPSYVIVDWDAYMDAASELAERDVRRSPNRWAAYRRLVRAIVETIYPSSLVMLGVCTPDELEGWPIDAWILLDCSDEERQHRLSVILESAEVNEALADAARYRALDLPIIDTTHKTPQAVAAELADIIRKPRP
jgi:broad-specificity NMP kinase